MIIGYKATFLPTSILVLWPRTLEQRRVWHLDSKSKTPSSREASQLLSHSCEQLHRLLSLILFLPFVSDPVDLGCPFWELGSVWRKHRYPCGVFNTRPGVPEWHRGSSLWSTITPSPVNLLFLMCKHLIFQSHRNGDHHPPLTFGGNCWTKNMFHVFQLLISLNILYFMSMCRLLCVFC